MSYCRVIGCKEIATKGDWCDNHQKLIFGKPKKSKPKNYNNQKSTKQKWREKAKRMCQKYCRLRDADKYGTIQCPTCPSRYDWNDRQGRTHARHFVPAEKNATCFDERNLVSGCGSCNFYKDHNPAIMKILAIKIDQKWGQGTSDELLEKSHQETRYDTFQYMAIYEDYKQRYETLYREKILGITNTMHASNQSRE